MLLESTNGDEYKFAIAYGRLCTALPYIAYHTVAVIIMTRGITKGGNVAMYSTSSDGYYFPTEQSPQVRLW